jgi:hypothetical protein
MKISNKDQFLIDRKPIHVSNELIPPNTKTKRFKDLFFESREYSNTIFQQLNNLNNLNNGSD